MKINIIHKPIKDVNTDLLMLTVFEGEEDSINKYSSLDENVSKRLTKLVEKKEITGKYKEFTVLHTEDLNAQRVLIMGLGKRKGFDLERLKAISARSARNVRRMKLSSMTVAVGFDNIEFDKVKTASAISEGLLLGLYKFKKYVSGQEDKDYRTIKELNILTKDADGHDDLEFGAARGLILAESTNFARDLVNEPSGVMTPQKFAEEAQKLAKESGMTIKVLGNDELKEENMNAFLAVNQGSINPAQLIMMEYNAGENAKTLGIVGKGVTFDSGGLSLKPSEGMFRMYGDMGGAAATLGAMKAIAALKPNINVVAAMGMTENLIDANSYRLADVLKTREGKTVEVLNTDAEGRLVMCDCLSYIRDYKKLDYLVDIATLTGAVIVALGHFTTGIMTNDDDFVEVVKGAGKSSGEKVWQLPLFEEYKSQIISDVADLENVGGRAAGSITAGIFLKEFVGDVPWVHIDIAGTALMDESIYPYAKSPFFPKEGGTGSGTRLLYYISELLANK